jgi:hypothetical protein
MMSVCPSCAAQQHEDQCYHQLGLGIRNGGASPQHLLHSLRNQDMVVWSPGSTGSLPAFCLASTKPWVRCLSTSTKKGSIGQWYTVWVQKDAPHGFTQWPGHKEWSTQLGVTNWVLLLRWAESVLMQKLGAYLIQDSLCTQKGCQRHLCGWLVGWCPEL